MLSTAKANALSTECLGNGGLIRLIRVRAHAKRAHLVGPFHQLGELLKYTRCLEIQSVREQNLQNFGGQGLNFASKYFTSATIDGDPIAFVKFDLIYAQFVRRVVDVQHLTSGNTDFAHLTCNQRGM